MMIKSRLLAAFSIWGIASARCATTALSVKTVAPTSVPPGWVHHGVNGVSLAAPAAWKIGPDPICAPVPADTIGVATADDRTIGNAGAVMIGVTNCPAANSTSPEPAPTAAWVSIECVLASRVALPPDAFVSTSGAQKVLRRTSDPFYVIGRGQALEVAAGTDSVAQQIMRTVVPTGGRC